MLIMKNAGGTVQIIVCGIWNGPERCSICGKYIAKKDLGITAIKENKRYLSDFVHKSCLAKRAAKIIDYINATRSVEVSQ